MLEKLTYEERLILDIWAEVEDKCTTEQIDEIAEGVGWHKLHGTVAGLQERRDLLSESMEADT